MAKHLDDCLRSTQIRIYLTINTFRVLGGGAATWICNHTYEPSVLRSLFFLMFCETESLCVALTALELTVEARLALDLGWSPDFAFWVLQLLACVPLPGQWSYPWENWSRGSWWSYWECVKHREGCWPLKYSVGFLDGPCLLAHWFLCDQWGHRERPPVTTLGTWWLFRTL